MMARLHSWLKSAGVWFNAVLLAAFPFTDQIVQAISDNLPALAQYLPPNVYKVVGFAVVVFNLVRSAQRARKAAQAKEVAHG
ncbi:hypothetical protein [Massilia phyllosphaerae]|uniref:hypothetical protein n=1 Tax=Massilia phyllosphaerae TaxID=3106034 RepID=UPI002B1CD971|nr:hypothetical protein [Massilia sp. SGZ-792]